MKSNSSAVLKSETEETQKPIVHEDDAIEEYSQDPKIIRQQLIQVKNKMRKKSKFFEKLGG